MWSSTPGEWITLVSGAQARERASHWMMAVVACSSSGFQDPWALLGEESPPQSNPDHADGWGSGDHDEARARMERIAFAEREQRRQAERAHRSWFPRGLRSPVQQTVDEEEESESTKR